MTRRDAVLFVGSAAIGMASYLYWRDYWMTTVTIIVACTVWVTFLRTVIR